MEGGTVILMVELLNRGVGSTQCIETQLHLMWVGWCVHLTLCCVSAGDRWSLWPFIKYAIVLIKGI